MFVLFGFEIGEGEADSLKLGGGWVYVNNSISAGRAECCHKMTVRDFCL